MARNKKPRKKKYAGPKQTTAQSNNLEPQNVIDKANLSPEQIQAEEVLFSLLERKIEIPVENFKGKHLFIATPCYGGQVSEPYLRSLVRLILLMNRFNVEFTLSTLANESLITRGRNTLTSFFMENEKATHMFFIDADIEFNPEDVLRMLAYDKPVITGAYPKKALNWDSILNAARSPNLNETAETIEGHSSNYVTNFDYPKDENGQPIPNVQIQNNLIKLLDAGTGFMMIKKEVIQKMFDAYPDTKYNNDLNIDNKFEPYMYALFDCIIDPESKRYLSEDYTFCRRWQAIGGEIWLDPRVALNHVGHYTFRGNVRKMLTGESTSSNYQSPDQRPFVIGISDGNFESFENYCLIPNSLVFSYSLALVTGGEAKNIYLAGFDGYDSDDSRNDEVNELLSKFKKSYPNSIVISITPTKYKNVVQKSVYGSC